MSLGERRPSTLECGSVWAHRCRVKYSTSPTYPPLNILQSEFCRQHHSSNEDYGSSGISLVDLDADGDSDLLYTSGDAFDYIPHTASPRPWHGIQWLENLGDLKFQSHRISNLPGSFSPMTADVDGDGDLDVVAVGGELGELYAYPHFSRMSRVTQWHNRWPERTVAQ